MELDETFQEHNLAGQEGYRFVGSRSCASTEENSSRYANLDSVPISCSVVSVVPSHLRSGQSLMGFRINVVDNGLSPGSGIIRIYFRRIDDEAMDG